MPTALIIGAGPRVGQDAAEAFAAAGYQVAVASRKQNTNPKFPFYPFDATEPEKLPSIFKKVSADVGIPSVVIYNGLLLPIILSILCLHKLNYYQRMMGER